MAFAVVLVLVVLAVWFDAGHQPKSRASVFKLGVLPIAATLPTYVAADADCFRERGLSVELVEFKSSNDVAQAAVTRGIDVAGIVALNAMLDASEVSGIGVKAFLFNKYVRRPSLGSTDFLVARRGIERTSDLKGKRIGVFPGTISQVFFRLVLPRHGLAIKDVQLIEMPPGQWYSALERGDVDAAHILEPQATLILDGLQPNVLIDGFYSELQSEVPASGAWFVDGVLAHDDQRLFFEAYACALDIIRKDPARARGILSKYTGLAPEMAPKVRLLDWSLSNDKSAVGFAEGFHSILRVNGATKYSSGPETWIYRP